VNTKKTTLKRKPTLRDAQKAHTRLRLLEAARNVFYREGYYGATVDQIVAEAGASRPTFYLHFKDKEEVLGVLMAEYAARAVPCMERLPGPRPTVDELKEWLGEVGRFIQQEIALYAVLGEVSTHRPPDSPHHGLATVDAWIEALGHRAPAFAAAAGKTDVNARARADLLIIEIVWAAGNIVRDKGSAFTAETVTLVARALDEFLNDARFHAKASNPTKLRKAR
jgi:AcrR family transcriptional regulator